MLKRLKLISFSKQVKSKVNRRHEMKQIKPWVIVILAMAILQFWGCQKHEAHHTEHPSEVEEIEGSEFSRVVLTEKAIERIDLQTSVVSEIRNSEPRLIVPYSSIIYGPEGQTWLYTSPEPRTFVRYTIDIDYIVGDQVFLKVGPPVGTTVVTVGVAELYGTEFKVGH
jgi:hypothetical protein